MEDSQPFNDGWRPVENEDWTAGSRELPLEDEQAKHADQQRPEVPCNTTGEVPPVDATKPAKNEGPIKLNLFTRPASSHEDPASKFIFSKMKPVSMSFSRQRKDIIPTTVLSNPAVPSSWVKEREPADPSPEPLTPEQALSAMNDLHQSVSMQNKLPNRSSEIAVAPTSQTGLTLFNDRAQCTSPTAAAIEQAPRVHDNQADRSASADDPMVAHESNFDSFRQINSFIADAANQPTLDAPVLLKTTETIRKPRRKSKQRRLSSAGIQTSRKVQSVQAEPSMESILNAVSYKVHKSEQDRDKLAALYKVKVQELERVMQGNSILYAELEKFKTADYEKEDALGKLSQMRTTLEKRVKKLCDFVKGLSNDYNRLRDTAQELREQHRGFQGNQDDTKAIHNALKALNDSLGQDAVKSANLVAESRRQVDILNHTVQDLQRQLQDNKEHLDAERQRNQSFKDEVSKITTSHEDLVNNLANHSSTLNEKLNALFSTREAAQHVPVPESQDQITVLLKNCVSMIQELMSRKVAQPVDVQKLDASVKGYTESVLRSIETLEHTTNTTVTAQQTLAFSVQEELRAMSATSKQKDALQEHVLDLRESRAMIRERMHQTEVSLALARNEVATLKRKGDEQSRAMMKTEIDAERAREQPTESAQTVQRLQELQSLNDDFQVQISVAQGRVDDLSTQLQLKDEETSGLRESLSRLQIEVEEGKDRETAAQLELSSQTTKAAGEREAMKKALLEAAEIDKINTKIRHDNEIHSLRQAASNADRKHEAAIKELALLKSQNAGAKNTTARVQAELRKVRDDNKAKDLRITALEALEIRMSQTSTTSQRSVVAESEHSEQLPAVVEDSQAGENIALTRDTENDGQSGAGDRGFHTSKDDDARSRTDGVGRYSSGHNKPESSNLRPLAKSHNDKAGTDEDPLQSTARTIKGRTPTQPALRGILKDATGSKRSTSTAGLSQASPAPAKKARQAGRQARATISGSQSPANGRPKIASKPGTKSTKDHQMSARFQRELE